VNVVHEFARAKSAGKKISVVTAYDAWSARLVARSNVDAILVGDSLAMVVHGHPTTIPATVELMALHTAAVARAAEGKFVITDLPFLSFRRGLMAAMRAVDAVARAGAQAVKLEGVDGHEKIVEHIVGSGIPVMGHLGLTPQSVNGLGGFRVQGRAEAAADAIVRQAHALEDLGVFSIVLECVPAPLASRITSELQVPTIGIGAGSGTDGQVLVFHDLCGLSPSNTPRFVRRYAEGSDTFSDALNRFDEDVKARTFPDAEESYA
jgi:3-methyl-2-oxobutanoate hydroxymethyltransferase